MPTGTPTTTPITAATVDCHATDAPSWRCVNPSAFNKANSRRLARTDAVSVNPNAQIAARARTAASRPVVNLAPS
jgi:hypothetical protein